MTEAKQIILCADDYGLNKAVAQGIRQLIAMKRLSATSCMVNMPNFKQEAEALLALNSKVQMGLHFNLTEGQFLSVPGNKLFSLTELLVKTHLRLITADLIRQEFNAQLDAFLEAFGRLPDFIDGHQHVHQFPVIRKVLLDVYQQRLAKHQVYIRSTYPAFSVSKYWLKALVLALTGGIALKHSLVKLKIPHNAYFAGIYDFAKNSNYPRLFKQILQQVKPNTLIMCHPGLAESDDAIAEARKKELAYFLSDEFVATCERLEVSY